MSGDRPYEGEYPGQMGMPLDDAARPGREPGRRADEPARRERPGDAPRRAAGEDGDLFVWDDLRPPSREQTQRPAADVRGDWAAPEFGAGGAAPRERRTPDDRRAHEDWRALVRPSGRRASARDSRASRERREWPDAEAPHGAEAIGHLPERHKGPRRRRLPAGAVLLAMLLGFFLAGLLDVATIKKDVEARPYGALRSVQLALLEPMSALSGAVRADDLSSAVASALGRGEPEHHQLAEAQSGKPLWPRAITASKPLRLYIAGDSMDQVFGSSLVNLSEETALMVARNDYKVSSGLTRPDFFDWPKRLVDQIVDFRPDAAVVLFGANDGQNVQYEGKVLKVGTKGWRAIYAQRVGQAMDILTQSGRRVYWVGNPIMREPGYRQRVAMMDRIYSAEAAKHPGVTFVSTWKLLADRKGSYTDYLKDANGDSVLMRAPDGIHLTRAGGDKMAALVLGVIEKDWGMGEAGSASPAP